MSHFSWIPFYEEMADKLMQFKDDRKPLIEIIYTLDSLYVGYIKSTEGGHVEDIDPFTVFGIFNRQLTDENRKTVCSFFKDKLGIAADVPSDFDGIPVLNPVKATFIWRENVLDKTPLLWDLFVSVIEHDTERFQIAFDKACKEKGIRWNITMGLYWIRPKEYISLETLTRDYLYSLGFQVFDGKQLDAAHYLQIRDEVIQKVQGDGLQEKLIPEVVYQAWIKSNKTYWLGGYTFNKNDSQFSRFIENSVWECIFMADSKSDQSLLKVAQSIKVDDVLMLKAAITKGAKHDQPSLRIKAVGVVVEEPIFEEIDKGSICRCRVCYYGVHDHDFDDASLSSYRKSIHKVTSKANALIAYANLVLSNGEGLDSRQIMKTTRYQAEVELLKACKNLIFTGAPGTGKTYMAKEIAHEMGCDSERMEFVQFHPSYDYSDFVEGLRPVDGGNGQIFFERKDGVFKRFCKQALKEPNRPFVFIIDEINRGEISKIFGELFFSIDPGYRGVKNKVRTQYHNLVKSEDTFADGFYVPENVYVIGTMNDIDRSVESMDFAMRRRFTWKEISYDSCIDMLDQLDDDIKKEAVKRLKSLNQSIAKQEGLGESYQIGPAYFLKLKTLHNDFSKLWDFHLKPLLNEYLRGYSDAIQTMDVLHKVYEQQVEKEDSVQND